VNLAAIERPVVQEARSEEESAPHHGKIAGSIVEQRKALAWQQTHLRMRCVIARAEHVMDWPERLSDLTVFPALARSHR